jgi:hypothetical protein
MRKLVTLVFFIGLVSCSPNIGKIHYPAEFKKSNGKAVAELYESIRLDVPETWYFGPKDPHHFRAKFSPIALQKVPFENNCIIEVTPFELKDESSETFQKKIDELKDFYSGYDHFKGELKTRDAKLVVQDYEYFYKENKIKGTKRYVHSGKYMYLLTYVGNTKVFDTYKREAIEILDSFRIKKD